MREKTLAEGIAKTMGLSEAHEEVLRRWDDGGKVGQGACLGDEVRRVAEQRSRCGVSSLRRFGSGAVDVFPRARRAVVG